MPLFGHAHAGKTHGRCSCTPFLVSFVAADCCCINVSGCTLRVVVNWTDLTSHGFAFMHPSLTLHQQRTAALWCNTAALWPKCRIHFGLILATSPCVAAMICLRGRPRQQLCNIGDESLFVKSAGGRVTVKCRLDKLTVQKPGSRDDQSAARARYPRWREAGESSVCNPR